MTDRRNRRLWLAGAAVFAAVLAVYLPTVGFQLVSLDDTDYLLGNPLLRGGFRWGAVAEAFRTPTKAMYAPLLWISYMLDIDVWHATRASPWGFHLTNALLHALDAALLYGLLRKWTGRTWAAAVCAGVWAFHPLRAESVAWVAERKDVLSGAFFLLALWAYGEVFGEGRRRAGRAGMWWLSFCFAGLGMLTKASLTPLPGVLLLMDFWPLKRCRWEWGEMARKGWRLALEKVPFALLSLGCSRMAVAAHASALGLGGWGLADRLRSVPVHYGFYLEKLVWPIRLHPLYPVLETGGAAVACGVAVLLALTWMAWRVRRRAPEILTGWLWFAGVLVPASGLVQFGAQTVADRFTYLPSMGLSLALVPAAAWAGQWLGRRRAAWAGAAVVAALAVWAAVQCRTWRDDRAMRESVARAMPRHYLVLQHRGVEKMKEEGDYRGALPLFAEAAESMPLDIGSTIYGSVCLCELVSAEAARADLERKRVLESIIDDYDWLMGVYCYLGGHHAEALEWVGRRAARNPACAGSETPENELGMAAAFRMGDRERALAYARKFRRWAGLEEVTPAELFPVYAMLWENYLRRDAAAYFLELEAAFPDRVDLLNNMAWLLATSHWSPLDAGVPLRMAERACELGGADNPILLDTLGVAQANAGDFAAAAETEERAIRQAEAVGLGREFRKKAEGRLKGYRRGQAYREEAGLRLL